MHALRPLLALLLAATLPAAAAELKLRILERFNFDTLDGVTYRIDVTQPQRHDRNGNVVAPEAHRIVGAGAIAHLGASRGVRLVKDNGDGSAVFELGGAKP